MKNARCAIRVESFDVKRLTEWMEWMKKESSQYGMKVGNVVSLPMKKKVWTVLRSPHIDKKSREQFEIRTYRQMVCVDLDSPDKMQEWISSFQEQRGVSIRLKWTKIGRAHV